MFIELLTEKDKVLIDFFREFGTQNAPCQCSEDFINCDYFLRFWEQSKTAFLKHIFKNKLIIKKRIKVTMEDDDLHDKISQITHSDAFIKMKKSIFAMIQQKNIIIGEAFDKKYSTILLNLEQGLFHIKNLISNRYDGETLKLILPNSKVFTLVHGCKVMKALGRLAKIAGNEKEFEEVRILQSQVLNEANISANLCLSIHPLDYMTASYNECGWDSCMCWDGGDYRRGVIEMMNSQYVLVAYLESDSQDMKFKINNEEYVWNSKRWREFFIVSEDGIFGIKGYPYWNREIEDVALEAIKELLIQDGQNQYSDTILHWDFSRNDIIFPHFSCGPAMYNDFYDGNTYHAIKAKGVTGHLFIDYSGVSECVLCGEEVENDEDSTALWCERCCPRHYCARCDEEIEYEEDIRYVDGEEYCSFCYENVLIRCRSCGDIIPDYRPSVRFIIGEIKDNKLISTLNETHTGQFYRLDPTPLDLYLCEYCINDIFVKGEKELAEKHLIYKNPWFSNANIDVIDYKNIKNLHYLDISSTDLKQFLNNLSNED